MPQKIPRKAGELPPGWEPEIHDVYARPQVPIIMPKSAPISPKEIAP